jgi:hypothetical protein
MGNILLHSNVFWFVQCSRDISTFDEQVFKPFWGLSLWVSIDDFGFYSDKISHLTKLKLILQCLDGLVVTLSPKKTQMIFQKGKWLGHCVKRWGSHKFQSLIRFQDFFFPPQKKPFEVFLGVVGYYQRFIHMFAAKTCPLTWFLWEDAPTSIEDETSKHAFE